MVFSVGYQLRDDDLLLSAIEENKGNINEIYFALEDFANGRSCSWGRITDKKIAKAKKEADFEIISKTPIKFNLLLNGNCYGAEAQSRKFFYKIGDNVEKLCSKYNLKCVTTTSPLIAKFIKDNFEDIEVRASVNMEIGETVGMDYVSHLFDSFYLKREYNRNIKKIKKAKDWCDKNGKKLYGLANSGCLNFCSTHTFHDNLVSHEREISQKDNAYEFEGQCWAYLKDKEHLNKWNEITNFIRPEDVYLYEDLFDGLKLATRVNSNPKKIIESYIRGSYSGSLPALLEPNHQGVFYPFIIENGRYPKNFGATVLNCNKDCNVCSYCKDSIQKSIVNLGG